MVQDALDGKIDLIVTKSVSRFARNTVDSLVTVRKLKEKVWRSTLKKENIYTLDSKGLLITIMSSLAQEESRSISGKRHLGPEKAICRWKGQPAVQPFSGLSEGRQRSAGDRTGGSGNRPLDLQPVPQRQNHRLHCKPSHQGRDTHPAGKKKWAASTVESILKNEKYRGDALLQKAFTVDFLTKKQKKNEGEVPQYYVENSHPAIIDPIEWKLVQQGWSAGKLSGAATAATVSFLPPGLRRLRRLLWL